MSIDVRSLAAGACALAAAIFVWACGSVSAPDALTCDASLWDHVYQPSRLKIVDACRVMTGVVLSEHHNDDGDVDMQVKPDAPYVSMLNDSNNTKLNGAMQVEAICQAPIQPNRPAAAPVCGTYQGGVLIPGVGQHVQVVGSYVLDTNHGWMEIHPVTRITILSP